MRDRNVAFHSEQHRDRIRRQVHQAYAVDFFNLLTGPELLEMTESHLPEHRERLYPPTVALSMFMKQALEEDRSCQRAVNGWAAQRAAEGLSVHSVSTGAYCRARGRVPLQMISALTRASGRLLCERAQEAWLWRGRRVKLADGTGISMPDTPSNQACYPQPSTQTEGVGFPLARLVGIICLSTGVVLEAAIGPHAGKGRSELDLFRSLLPALSTGDLLLADALYCNYFLIATLQAAGVDVLFEQHGARITDFRRGEALGKRDHRVRWHKPEARPAWMSREQYAVFPEELMVRELQVGGRTLVTTLLEPKEASKGELAKLYERRWNIELDLRCIKTTLRMETLSCKSPSMVQRELWVYLLAYNLIRFLMAQAAHTAGVQPRELSFKHTVQMWTTWTALALAALPVTHPTELFRLIAQLRVGNRPRRVEPRARKRRPKPFPWLKIPRARARRQIRQHRHRLSA
ncbi:MAG TPA: IS4 family transposase [Steroidobacteraceae bacterium]|nr:IS4 family transposase [Steroidobacteraceae bacterium]